MAKAITVRRSELTLPGHMMKFLEKAAASEADEIMADCEDACPLSAKGPEVRGVIVEAFTTLDWGNKFVTFRPNNTQSPFFEGDMEHVVKGAVDKFHGVIVPKTFEPWQIEKVDELLTTFEAQSGWKTKIQIEALIETAQAVENAYAIATASDRMASLVFGIADYAADIGVADAYTDQNIRFLYAKQRVINAAKAAGLDAIDNVHLQIRDMDALRRYSAESAGYGFDGRWAITPTHIEIINEVYTPTDDQIAHAKKVVDLYEQADTEQKLGAIVDPDNGEMIDEATIKIAFKQLLKGFKAGKVEEAFMSKALRSSDQTGYNFLGVELAQRV
ncbi:MAG: HpcH/HpaI aldolase/citrate lyase family protein [Dehalococcoidia bacterium]